LNEPPLPGPASRKAQAIQGEAHDNSDRHHHP
jgi:hypothetical protein